MSLLLSRRAFVRGLGGAVGSLWLPYGFLPAWAQVATSRDFPPPSREIRVTNSAALAEALKSAAPGTHILLADGEYGGGLAAAARGTSAAPVVVRGETFDPTNFRARIEGGIKLVGEGVVLHGVEIDGGGSEFGATIDGAGNKILRCSFPGQNGVHVLETASQWHVGCNAFTGRGGGGRRQDGICIEVNSRGGADPGLIERNLFAGGDDSDRESHAIYLGSHDVPGRENVDIKILHNLVGTKEQPYASRRHIYCKHGCMISGNAVWAERGAAGLRNGHDGILSGNSFVGTHNVMANGPGHMILGNRWEDTRFDAMAESHSRDNNKYRAVDSSVFAGNSGRLDLGAIPGGGRLIKGVDDVMVMDHSGEVNRVHVRSMQEGGVVPEYPAVGDLTEDMVGPGAPDVMASATDGLAAPAIPSSPGGSPFRASRSASEKLSAPAAPSPRAMRSTSPQTSRVARNPLL